jgi:hypothetical protein
MVEGVIMNSLEQDMVNDLSISRKNMEIAIASYNVAKDRYYAYRISMEGLKEVM